MKRITYFILSIVAISSLFISCKEDDNTGTAPGKVTNIKGISGFGEIMFSWNNPSDADFHYVSIEYINSNGEFRSKKISRFAEDTIVPGAHEVDSVLISGFSDAKDYTFQFFACDKDGNRSAPEIISVAPKSPAFEIVAPTVKVTPTFGGMRVVWDNPTSKNVTIRVNYINKTTGKATASKKSSNPTDTLKVENMTNNTQTVLVSIGDSLNVGEVKEFTVTPMYEEDLNQKTWAVIDFQSEEPTGEGSDNGKAIYTIDGNLSTFWHSLWTESGAELPGWITYDMKNNTTISKLSVTRRPNNKALKTVNIYVSNNSSDFGTMVGQIIFADADAGGATKQIEFINPPKGRYLKLVMPDTNAGGAVLSMAEVQAKGSVSTQN